MPFPSTQSPVSYPPSHPAPPLPNHRIITLCGSTKFKGYFELANRYLTLAGNTVFSVGHFPHQEVEPLPSNMKSMLDEIHKHKIYLSESIFVINPGGYIGSSTWSEISFAVNQCKGVYFLDWESGVKLSEDLKDSLTDTEVQAVLETIIDLVLLSRPYVFEPEDVNIPGRNTRLRELGKFAARLREFTSFEKLRKHPLELGFEP
ncbi:hypothetical protein U2F10_03145 [Leptothoe sp. EHU-05/26/07-4]